MLSIPQELPAHLTYFPILLTLVCVWALIGRQKCFRTFRRRMAKESGLRRHYRNCMSAVLVLSNICFVSSDDYYIEVISIGYTILLLFDHFSHCLLTEIHDHLSLFLLFSFGCAATAFFPIFWGLSFELFVIIAFSVLYPSWELQDMTVFGNWPDGFDQQDELVRKYYIPRLRRNASSSLGNEIQN